MNDFVSRVVAGSIGGLVVAGVIRIYNILTRPRLDMSFKDSDTFDEVPIGKIGEEAKAEFLSRTGLYVHLNIENKRRNIARGCKIFLTKLEIYDEKNKEFREINLKKPYNLKWANEDDKGEGYSGLEITKGNRRRVDLIHGERGDDKAGFFIKLGWLGIPNMIKEGAWRMTIQATGENTKTITKKFIFVWKGKEFLKENINVIEETLEYKGWRFAKNKLNISLTRHNIY